MCKWPRAQQKNPNQLVAGMLSPGVEPAEISGIPIAASLWIHMKKGIKKVNHRNQPKPKPKRKENQAGISPHTKSLC